MANRVVGQEVKEIIDTDKTNIEVEPFIAASNAMIEEHLVGQGLGAALLKEIERWLAAHFLAIADPREDFVWIGEARARFGGKFGLGLDFTAYGQQVKMLDTTGILANMGKPRASFAVISEYDTA